jgi:hypothetical protein
MFPMLLEAAPTLEGLTVAAMLVLAAFAIDRLASGVIFLAFRPSEKKESEMREWWRKLCYFLISSAVALPLVYYMKEMRLLTAIGLVKDQADNWKKFVDGAMTFLVLVGGADRLSEFLGMGGAEGGGKQESQPVTLTGTVMMVPAEKNDTGTGATAGK